MDHVVVVVFLRVFVEGFDLFCVNLYFLHCFPSSAGSLFGLQLL